MSDRPHVLIVRDAGKPYDGFLSMHDWDDWEIEHFDDCPTETIDHDDAGVPLVVWRCAVGAHADECGVRWSLRYSGTPVDKPGRYVIEHWAEEIRGYEWTEWDAGLRLVEEGESRDD